MKNIFGSSRRLALLALILTLCVGFMVGKVPVELFVGVVGTVVAFFFGQHSADSSTQNQPTEVKQIEK